DTRGCSGAPVSCTVLHRCLETFCPFDPFLYEGRKVTQLLIPNGLRKDLRSYSAREQLPTEYRLSISDAEPMFFQIGGTARACARRFKMYEYVLQGRQVPLGRQIGEDASHHHSRDNNRSIAWRRRLMQVASAVLIGLPL